MMDIEYVVEVLEPAGTLDDFGSETGDFDVAFTTRAGIKHMKGGEAVREARIRGEQPVEFKFWRSAQAEAITPGWRIRRVETEAQYDVRTIVPSLDRIYLEITATLIPREA